MELDPPPGYTARAATLEDAGGFTDLLNTCTLDETGVAWTNESDMREDPSDAPRTQRVPLARHHEITSP